MRRALAAAAASLACAACAAPDAAPGAPGDPGSSSGPDDPDAPTYWKDVYPVLAARCHGCHLNGPSSYRPWFDSHEHVAEVAGNIAIAVRNRHMPPWAVTADGTCGEWDRAHWLPDEEIAALVAWADSDLLEGDPADAERALDRAPAPAPAAPFRADAVLDTGVDYRPALGDRLHRCFRAPLALARAAQLTAFRVRAGNRRAVQHVSVFALDTDDAAAQIDALEGEDAEPGYHCFGGPRVTGARLVGTWTWGETTFRFPDGTGVRLEPGRDLVVQIHYSASGGSAAPAPDRTRIDLELSERAREGRFVPLEVPALSLAPRRPFTAASALLTTSDPMIVHGVYPLMHSLGHSMLLVDAGSDRCLAEVRHWDLYGHMRFHAYREPVTVAAGARLWLECGYDTRSRTDAVESGEALEDEACRASLYATDPRPR